MAINASSVSRQLKAAGFGIVATRNREGIRVSNGALKGYVSATVDLDRPGEARRLADALEEYLRTALVDTGISYRRDGVHFTVIDANKWTGSE